MGGWRRTLGTHDLNPRSRGFPRKSDGTRLGEERCPREAIDPTKPDVIRQCQEVYLVDRSFYVMELIRSRGDKQLCWTGGCVFQCSVRRGRKARLRTKLLSLLIHVGLQAACSMVTCSGLPSIVLEMDCPEPGFSFRV